MKVLIIDDSPDAVAVARVRLKKDGLDVCVAPDGQTGLDMAASEKPDLILLDIAMPGMSGFEVCHHLKADPNLSMIPVIFLTAMDDTEQKVRGLELGAVDYVTKPFDGFELRARVNAALRTKRFADMLIEHANVDPLTELPNRRALTKQLEKEWARVERHGGSFSLIMVDVDHFKVVNDTYGHSVGDHILRSVAQVLAGECREVDTPARYGGEEFAIVAPNQSTDGATTLAERCRVSLEQMAVEHHQEQIQVTASFGVADSTNADSVIELVEQADACLYEAKAGGRNAVCCHSSAVRS